MNQTTCAVDNSALLYLALMRKRHTNTNRFTMTMDHEVDPEALQQAMDRIYRRFPTIIAGFRREWLRYRVVPVAEAPLVLPDPGVLNPMTREEIETCTCRIFYRGRDIAYEGFHAAADGFGAIACFTTLAAEYLRIRNQVDIPVCNTLRDWAEAPLAQELEDAYLVHQQGKPMQCILTPRAGSPYNCAVIALNGRLTITFSRFCRQPELEAVFFAKLDKVLAA